MSEKIIWSEGTLLSQQHLQQFEQWVLHQITNQDCQAECHWGIQFMHYDQSKLNSGIVEILSLLIKLPSGLIINHSNDNHPLCLSLQKKSCIVYLNLFNNHRISNLNGYNENNDNDLKKTKWLAYYTKKKDLYDPRRIKEICIGRINFFLTTEPCNENESTSIPLLKLNNQGGQQYTCDHDYISPFTQTSKNKIIKDKLETILQSLEIANTSNLEKTINLRYWLYLEIHKIISSLEQHPYHIYNKIGTIIKCIENQKSQPTNTQGEDETKFDLINIHNLFHDRINKLSKIISKEKKTSTATPLSIERKTKDTYRLRFNSELALDRYFTIDFISHYSDKDDISEIIKLSTASKINECILHATKGIDMKHQKKHNEHRLIFKMRTELIHSINEKNPLLLYIPEYIHADQLQFSMHQ